MEDYGRERSRGTVLMRPFSKFLKHIKNTISNGFANCAKIT
ncbi:Uncharacterised protein [Mycobacteroides abscessus subsp. abscessus]|nr:Uncharacterised protein [Mycobacteroides abscessus subsp. abscessus]